MFALRWRIARTAFCALLCLALAGCVMPELSALPGGSGTVPAPLPAATDPAEPLAPGASEPGPAAADPLPTEVDLAPAVADLFEASLGIDLEGGASDGPGIESVAVLPLNVPPDMPPDMPPAYLAHTVGLRDFLSNQSHVVAIYARVGEAAVAEAARVVLAEEPNAAEPVPMPDFVGAGGVRQVAIEPTSIWLALEGGVGAHSGVFHLLRFAGETLSVEVSAFNSSPGVGRVEDLNGDGVGEVIVNATDPYVFCYACGVRLPQYALWRWTGEQMERVTLESLPAEASPRASAFNDGLITLATHGFWNDVERELVLADTLLREDASGTLAWNLQLLRLNAGARRLLIEEPSAYPLLDHVFFGDYAGAVDLMRPYAPDAIFSPQSPLIVGSVAEGWEATLAAWLQQHTEAALALKPDLAAAHFLLGWAHYLVGDANAAGAEVRAAAELAPDEPLYTESAALLNGSAAAPPARLTAAAPLAVYEGPGSSYPQVGELLPAASVTVTGHFRAGSDIWWQIALDAAPAGRGWVAGDAQAVVVENGERAPFARPPVLVRAVAQRGRLFYSLPDADGISRIYSVDVVEGAEPVEVIAEARLPALHPQGDILAFASQRPDMLGLGGLNLRSGERLRYSFNLEDMLPRWDDAGDRLLFSSTREGDRRPRIYWVWADGNGEAHALRTGFDADWSRAGGRIVFKGCDDVGAACGLYTMAEDGTGVTPLTDNAGDSRPRWSPDGAWVVFMSEARDGNWEIYVVPAAGGAPMRLTDSAGLDGLPAPSPDGQSLAFVTNRDGNWALATMPLDSTPLAGGPATTVVRLGPDFPNWLDHGLEWVP